MKSGKRHSLLTTKVFVAPPLPDGYAETTEFQAEAATAAEPVPKSAIPDVTIPPIHRDYWNHVESQTIGRHRDTSESGAMDTGDDEDEAAASAMGGGGEERGQRRTIHELFHEMRKEIDTSGSPACIVSQDQKWIVPFFPANELGTKMASKWLVAIPSMVLRAGRTRYVDEATAFVSARMILPTVVHESPLALLLGRDALASTTAAGNANTSAATAPVARFTDAITSFVNLFVFQRILREMDTSSAEHKSVADNYRKLLTFRAGDTFYTELDKLSVELAALPKTDRKGITDVVIRFARAAEVYALAQIHILEWFILDMCRVPFKVRPGLMTPNMLHLDATVLTPSGFDILRSLLCLSMRNRQTIFPLEVPSLADEKVTIKTERPLDNDFPCKIEDRLSLLASYVHGKTPDDIARLVLFGTYNGWIDIFTLHQFMNFLALDDLAMATAQGKGRKGTNLTDQEAELIREVKMDVSE